MVFFKPNDTLKPVEYNFIVNPGGKISDIQLKFKGAKTKLKDGKLSMNLRFGEMQENIPHSWEEEGNLKKSINVGFKYLGNGVFGFNADQDISDKTVVIDPVPTRIWGSYFGGVEDDLVGGVETDHLGFVHLYGFTLSKTNIATSGTYNSTYQLSTYNNFLYRVDSSGNKIWGTYINETGIYFRINDISISNNSTIYVAGFDNGNGRAKVYSFDDSGNLKKTLDFVGSGSSTVMNIKTINNSVYMVGKTSSPNGIATPGSFQESNANYSNTSFIIKTDSDLTKIWGTYFGGTFCSTELLTCNLDSNENIQVFGTTQCSTLPLKDEFQSTLAGSGDGVYARFDKNGNLLQSSYLGYSETDFLYNGKITSDNKLIIVGNFDLNFNDRQDGIFVIDLDTNLIISKKFFKYRLNNMYTINHYSSYIDHDNNIYLAGNASYGADIATPDAYQNAQFSNHPFIVKISPYGTKLWGTHYGGIFGGFDSVFINKDKNGYIYLAGNVSSGLGTDVSTNGTIAMGRWDTFLAKFKECGVTVLVNSNSPICVASEIKLFASGGTSYSWTGPNGFISSTQNPIIPNASAAMAGTYSCIISGTGGCDGTFSVVVKVEDKTAPIPNLSTLPTITGNCKTIITTIPTATDNCVGNIIATTTNPLQYTTPGNYVIVWNYNDGNGNISTQNQNINIVSEPLPTANPSQNFCKITQPKISDLQITGTDINWYDVAGNSLNTSTLLADATKYYATQTLNGCESAKTEITVTVNDPNPPTGNNLQDFCSAQFPKISDLVATGQNILWYENSGTLIPASTLLSDGKTYYGTQTVNGCESTQKIAVTVTINNGGIPANDYSTVFCNDTTATTKNINLHDYKGNLVANPTDYSFDFYYANNQIVPNPAIENLSIGENIFNVKVYNSLGCLVYVKLSLTLNPKPILNLRQDEEFCDGQSVDLDAGSGFSSYEWTKDNEPTIIFNQQIFPVSEVGKYTVRVTNAFNCENTVSINVTKAVIATITGVQIVNSTATVLLSNSGNFEYSLDNLVWQDSNIFPNLPNGNYTVFVRTKLGCIIGSANFSIFSVANVFTPDADGINDIWKIDGLENYPNSEVQVYDRFGNMVLQKIINGTFEWNGTFNSRKLPTGNYWYVVKVSDGRLLNGWVLLKNRN